MGAGDTSGTTSPSKFQIKIDGQWKNYSDEEDKILKRAFVTGLQNARFKVRGNEYEYDFKNMCQKNISSGKCCAIRPPSKWKAPTKPIVPTGMTTCIKVPKNGPGTTILVPHPKAPEEFIRVSIPEAAKV